MYRSHYVRSRDPPVPLGREDGRPPEWVLMLSGREHFFPLPGFEPPLLCRPARSLVTISSYLGVSIGISWLMAGLSDGPYGHEKGLSTAT